ncbi:Rap1a/Tai family immunity protein [Massilia sp. CCM 8734]|uniref:Rap1a/Tai family immunity protein n=1 Tax=Massilia sp. CCM 8734 TaxID=2609283 RepID=UPI001421F54B|nr:Rap1a/Tai family immunity protein [Massilia sp. CCM 8734]NHZ99345.1 hypothetical protein [Massilia sp. CCM 8734]
MKTIFLITALSLPLMSHGAPLSTAISGDKLIRQYLGDPSQRHATPKGDAYVDRETARGYMDGVKDLTEGERWCDPRNAPPHEIHIDVVQAIAQLSADRRRTNAAVLVLETLSRLYPCKPNGGKS